MIKFDDYNYKDISKYSKVQFISKSENIENPWHTTNGAKKVLSIFYKLDLLDSIKIALKEGIHPSNIFIMEENFTNEHNWHDLVDKGRIKAFHNLHYSGSIIPMHYNKFHVEISHLFSFTKEIRKKMNEQSYVCFNNNELDNFIKDRKLLHLKYDVTYIIEELTKITIEKNKLNSDIEYITKIALKTASKYIEEIKRHLKSESDENYYFKFFNKFKELDRPIVAIIDDFPSFNFKLLCQHNLLYDYNYPNAFLDLYSMSHESPIKYILGITTTLVAIYTTYITDKHFDVQNAKLKAETEFIEVRKNKLKKESELIDLEKDRAKYELCLENYVRVEEELSRTLANECKNHIKKYEINYDIYDVDNLD